MNSPQFVEASRALAENVLRQHDQTDEQLRSIFQQLTARLPTDDEMLVLSDLQSQQLALFQENKADAESYLKVGAKAAADDIDKAQLAALTGVVNALFGLDEVMMKR